MNNFYIIDDSSKQQSGPFTPEELRTKNILPTTMVWATGMQDWAQASTVSELDSLFGSVQVTNTQSATPPQIPNNYSTPRQSTTTKTVEHQSMYQSNVYGNQAGGKLGHGLDIESQTCPKTWLVESILFAALCCSPVAIVGIIYAAKVESRYNSGDYEGAQKASKYAKNFTLASLIVSVGSIALYLFLMVILGVSGAL